MLLKANPFSSSMFSIVIVVVADCDYMVLLQRGTPLGLLVSGGNEKVACYMMVRGS
jgi:preprotein translocase subunit SecG